VTFAFIGAGAVGGYFGAMLSRAGLDVRLIARGAHLEAIKTNGLKVVSAAVGDFVAWPAASSDPATFGHVDVVVLAVKTYDNEAAISMIPPLVGPHTTVLTLQNGVDSAEAIASVIGEGPTIGGTTYVATAIEAPGVIFQTGSHRRIVIGEYFGERQAVSERVAAIADVMKTADIHAEPVADGRAAVWEKFTYLAPFAAFTGAARLPVGPLWADAHCRAMFLDAVAEVAAVARAEGIPVPADYRERISAYADALPPSTRSSLLIDLSQGKRIEVEALQGSVVRRGQAAGVATPIMSTLYAVLKLHLGSQGVKDA
jgi:2-dehydropantoate 2-reductase